MEFKNILNKGKEYASKVKDNINKTIEEANQKKALLEEKIANLIKKGDYPDNLWQ